MPLNFDISKLADAAKKIAQHDRDAANELAPGKVTALTRNVVPLVAAHHDEDAIGKVTQTLAMPRVIAPVVEPRPDRLPEVVRGVADRFGAKLSMQLQMTQMIDSADLVLDRPVDGFPAVSPAIVAPVAPVAVPDIKLPQLVAHKRPAITLPRVTSSLSLRSFDIDRGRTSLRKAVEQSKARTKTGAEHGKHHVATAVHDATVALTRRDAKAPQPTAPLPVPKQAPLQARKVTAPDPKKVRIPPPRAVRAPQPVKQPKPVVVAKQTPAPIPQATNATVAPTKLVTEPVREPESLDAIKTKAESEVKSANGNRDKIKAAVDRAKHRTAQSDRDDAKRSRARTGRQHARHAAAQHRGRTAKSKASKRGNQAAAQQKAQTAQMKQQLIAEATQHAELAIAAIDLDGEALHKRLEQDRETQIAALHDDLAKAKETQQTKLTTQLAALGTEHTKALSDIDSDCNKQIADNDHTIAAAMKTVIDLGERGARDAISDGERDAHGYAQARDALKKDEKTPEKVAYFNNLISTRRQKAKDAATTIRKTAADHAKQLHDQKLKDLDNQVELTRTESKSVADDRYSHDQTQLQHDLDEEFKKLEAENEAQDVQIRLNCEHACTEAVTATKEQKDQAKADIKTALDTLVSKVKAASAKQLGALSKDVSVAYQAIDTKLGEISKARAVAVQSIVYARNQQQFRLRAVDEELDKHVAAAIEHQRNTVKRTADTNRRLGKWTDDAAERVVQLQKDQNSLIALQATNVIDEVGNDADYQAEVKELQRTVTNGNIDLFGDGASKYMDVEVSGFRNAARKDFEADNTAEEVADKKRDREIEELPTLANPAGKDWKKEKPAKIQELIAKTGDVYNSTGEFMQILATVSPDELNEMLNDPKDGAELAARIAAMHDGDKTWIDKMTKAKSTNEMRALLLEWSANGGDTGASYNMDVMKAVYAGSSDKDRTQIDAEFTKLDGRSVKTMMDQEAFMSVENNRMLQAYRTSNDAAIAEETRQAEQGGYMTDWAEMKEKQNAQWDPTGLAKYVDPSYLIARALSGRGTDQAKYLAARDRLMALNQPPPFATEAEIAESQQKTKTSIETMNKYLRDSNANTTIEQLDREFISNAGTNQARQSYDTALIASREGRTTDYKNNAAVAAATDNLGDRQRFFDRQRELSNDPAEREKFNQIAAKASPGQTFEDFAKTNFIQPIDRDLAINYANGTVSPALQLVYAQYGGRTGIGDDKKAMSELAAKMTPDQRAEYERLVKEYKLSGQTTWEWIEGNPLGKWTIGQYSTGNVDGDMEKAFGGQWNRWTDGAIGEGHDYHMIKYDLANGEALTATQKLARQKEMVNYDLESSTGMGYEQRAARREFDAMQEAYRNLPPELRDRKSSELDFRTMTPEQREQYSEFLIRQQTATTWLAGARERQAQFVEGVGWVVGTTVGVAAGVAAIVLSGGTATPVVIAAASAIAGGLATMGVKYAVLGAKYGGDQFQTDAAGIIIDAVASSVLAAPAVTEYAEKLAAKAVSGPIARAILAEMIKGSVENGADLSKRLLDPALYQGTQAEVLARLRGLALSGAGKLVAGSIVGGTMTHTLTGRGWNPEALATEMVTANAVQLTKTVCELDPSKPPAEQLVEFLKAATTVNAQVLVMRGAKKPPKESEESEKNTGDLVRHTDGTVEIDGKLADYLRKEIRSGKDLRYGKQSVDADGRRTYELTVDGKPLKVVVKKSPTDEPEPTKEQPKQLTTSEEPEQLAPYKRDLRDTEMRRIINKGFAEKFGDKPAVAWRGMRLKPDSQVDGVFVNWKNQGQIVGFNRETALHYGTTAGNAVPGGSAGTVIVLTKFEITPDLIYEDPDRGPMDHVFLFKDVDIKTLPGYDEEWLDPVTHEPIKR